MPADYIVTGAAQPLAQHIIARLTARDCRVVGVDRPDAGGGGCAPFLAADLRDEECVRQLFRAEAREYTVVIHADERITLSDQASRELTAANVLETKNLLRAAVQQRVRRFVYAASSLALGPAGPSGVLCEPESFDTDTAFGPYGRSKAAACAAVAQSAAAGLDSVIVLLAPRFGGPGGPYPLDLLLRRLADGRGHFGVTGGLDLICLPDAAQGVVLAADKGVAGRSYILTGGHIRLTQLYALSRRLCGGVWHPPVSARAAGLLVPLVRAWDGERPLFTKSALSFARADVHLSCERAERELGFHPQQLHDALAQALRFHAQAKPEQLTLTTPLPALAEGAAAGI